MRMDLLGAFEGWATLLAEAEVPAGPLAACRQRWEDARSFLQQPECYMVVVMAKGIAAYSAHLKSKGAGVSARTADTDLGVLVPVRARPQRHSTGARLLTECRPSLLRRTSPPTVRPSGGRRSRPRQQG